MNTLVCKLKSSLSLITLAAVFTMVSCDDKEPEKIKEVDPSNPTAVTSALVVPNGTLKSGDMPAPSADPNAPVLQGTNTTQTVAQGGVLVVNADVASGSAAGFYVQVKGASQYFDINSTTYAGGRIKQGRSKEDQPAFSIEAPSNFKSGEFCIFYSVYDGNKRVSNPIEVCITVKEVGGENSAFLTANPWEFVSRTEMDSDTTTEVVGETYTNNYSQYLQQSCENGYMKVSVTEEWRTDYAYVTFLSNGTMSYDAKEYKKRFDLAASNASCSAVYDESTITDQFNGFWSYDDSAKKLTLMFTKTEEHDGVEETRTAAMQFIVTQSNSNVIITSIPFAQGDSVEKIELKIKD